MLLLRSPAKRVIPFYIQRIWRRPALSERSPTQLGGIISLLFLVFSRIGVASSVLLRLGANRAALPQYLTAAATSSLVSNIGMHGKR
jgi:hypothetical protein